MLSVRETEDQERPDESREDFVVVDRRKIGIQEVKRLQNAIDALSKITPPATRILSPWKQKLTHHLS